MSRGQRQEQIALKASPLSLMDLNKSPQADNQATHLERRMQQPQSCAQQMLYVCAHITAFILQGHPLLAYSFIVYSTTSEDLKNNISPVFIVS